MPLGSWLGLVLIMSHVIAVHFPLGFFLVPKSSNSTPLTQLFLILQGCDTFTISPSVAMKMFMVESTLDYFADFEAAARRNGAYEG